MLERLPAGPAGKLRSTHRVLRNPFASLAAWQKRFGDPFTIPTVNGTVVMTGDPKLVKEIFAADPATFAPWAAKAIGPTIGNASVLALTEPRHMKERKLLMPPFHGERMRAYAETMARVAERRFAEVAGSQRFLALELGQSISLEVIVRAVFGAQDDELAALGSAPDPAEYAKQPYLEATCKEAMRIHPVVTEVLRMCVKPFRLGEIEIPVGVGVSAGAVLVHWRDDLYPEPAKFRPERFLERKFAPYEYLPFGGGHRRCIGAAFASFEMAVVLGTALSHFDFELTGDVPPKPVGRSVTMAPSGSVPLRAKRR